MITVAILINGNPIVANNAVNTGRMTRKGYCQYLTDGGKIIWHKRADGAVALAKRLLDLIKNEEFDLARYRR